MKYTLPDRPIFLRVKPLPPDFMKRPRLKNLDSRRIYVDVSASFGSTEQAILVGTQVGKINGRWYTTSKDGEPCTRLLDNCVFVFFGK